MLLVMLCFSAAAQDSLYTLNGYVYDRDTSTPLPGATVYIASLVKGVTTNEQGYYTLHAPAGNYQVTFSFIGYERDSVMIDLSRSVTYSIRLRPSATTIAEVTVSAQKEDEKLKQTETGHISIQKKDIESLPYLLGEIDPVRILQLMPGVQTAGEGSTGFYVRGGAIDQNLMMLDNTTIYNPSHLFGFFSIFNGATVNNIDLYKSGIPSYYGGRLSSITNVTTRSGNKEKFHGEGNIGLIATNILVEGPIKKSKGSFLVAARRTYVDLFAKALRDLSLLKQDIRYYFYDLNVNADYQLGPKDNIRFRGYLGNDDFHYNTSSTFKNDISWKNTAASIQWQHTFHENLFSELIVGTSLYDMKFGASINTYVFNVVSNIDDKNILYQFNLQKKKHDISWGLQYIHHTLRPNNIHAYSDSVELNISPQIKLRGEEAAIFLNDKIKLSDKVEVSAGIRFSGYSQLGPFTRYVEDENFQILDTITYSKGKRIKTYMRAEPRLAVRYSLNDYSSIKFSYDKTYQYMHMAPLSSVSLPLDVWVPSSSIIKPQ
ncbi:MAG TPA: TonB-dependent receptor, partial [Ohtaekwangia sp.]|uniref:TonB-dependent receptor n=1 Tax=Ohtaekwangia sp. TaxID=2066019 RepID=UPI002F955CA8